MHAHMLCWVHKLCDPLGVEVGLKKESGRIKRGPALTKKVSLKESKKTKLISEYKQKYLEKKPTTLEVLIISSVK